MALAARDAQAMPNIPQMVQVWAPLDRALGNVVAGVQSPEDAAHTAATEIKRSLGITFR